VATPEAVIRTAEYEPEIASPDFEAVYRKYAEYVTRVVRRHADHPSDVDDLVQEAFLRAYRSWPALELDRPVRPWLRKIAEATCIDSWRTKNRQRRPRIVFGQTDDVPRGASVHLAIDDPADIVHARRISDTVNDALDALEPRQRRVLLMKEVDGIRCESIALAEGTTAQGLRATLTRARKRFRNQYLTLAQERGLGALIFAPIGLRLRLWRHRFGQQVARLGLLPTTSPVEMVVPAAAQAVKVFVAAAVFVGGAVPALAAPIGDMTESILGFQNARSRSEVATGVGGPGADNALDDGAGTAPSAEAPGNGDSDGDGTALLPAPPPSGDIGQRHGVPDAPEETGFVTAPNRQVYDIGDTKVRSFANDPGNDAVIFAAGRNRLCEANCPAVLLVSGDGGKSWSKLEGEGFDSDQIFVPPAYPTDARIFGVTPSGAVQVSTDGGETFGPAAPGGTSSPGPAAISPLFNAGDPRIVIGTSSGIVEYRDDTATMGPAPFAVPPGGTLRPTYAPSGQLMVGGLLPDESRALGSAVFRCEGSVCRGTRISDERVTPKVRPSNVDPDVVVAFTENSVFRSADGGASFDQVARPGGAGTVKDVAIGDDGRLFAGVWGERIGENGLWVSADGGETWSQVDGELFAQGVWLISASGPRLLASLGVSGVACSTDDGATWAKSC
jgi:RNA polymerase sigma-70 factor (ECF subfamily)